MRLETAGASMINVITLYTRGNRGRNVSGWGTGGGGLRSSVGLCPAGTRLELDRGWGKLAVRNARTLDGGLGREAGRALSGERNDLEARKPRMG